MSPTNTLTIFVFFCCAISYGLASDPDTLQDFCVALPSSGVKVNGFACKPEANVTESDFFFDGLAKPIVINSILGLGVIAPFVDRVGVTAAFVDSVPGFNTLGVSLARVLYNPGGLIFPHTHPRATELVFVLDGELDVGFITTSNKFITKSIKKGEIFVFPKGLIHYQKNNGDKPASLIAFFNSQLPGVSIPTSLFTSTPAVPDDVLAQTFQVDTNEVERIKAMLAPKKS